MVVVHAQFLSMKLASMNPIFYDFEWFESSALQNSPFHQAAPEEASRSCTMKEASAPLLLHGQGPISLPQVCFWYTLYNGGFEILSRSSLWGVVWAPAGNLRLSEPPVTPRPLPAST
ncbi:hypothetical protein GW17_00003452 [Ensete ventricosum]|nr:hypothetical protein GW17_00003452 [Ensete ventricosum]